MDFEAYLKAKNIDAKAFKSGDTKTFQAWKFLFDQVHPNSFTQQKLFLINKIRRAYQLEEKEIEKTKPVALKRKPKINPKPKLK